jgi:ribosome-binding protein aMBF1 (putative translation factor)
MITPEQSRAARGWLDWSQGDLAKRASVSLSTVRDFEKGRRLPIANNRAAIERVLNAAGIRMVERDGEAAGIEIEAKPAARKRRNSAAESAIGLNGD